MIYDGVITKPPLNEETLAHYGVMGMKWGVRKNPEKFLQKARKRKDKLMDKATKNLQKDILKSAKKGTRLKVRKKTDRSVDKFNDYDKKVKEVFLKERSRLDTKVGKKGTDEKIKSLEKSMDKYLAEYVKINPNNIKIEKKKKKITWR